MKLESLSRSLAEHPFLRGLSPEDIDFFCGCTRNVRLAAGELLFREGHAADHLYLLREGRVDLSSDVPGKGPVVLERLEPGESLGASVVSGSYVWHVDARAVGNVVAFSVDGACLRAKFDKEPRFGFQLVKRMLEDVHCRLSRSRLQQLDVYKSETAAGA